MPEKDNFFQMHVVTLAQVLHVKEMRKLYITCGMILENSRELETVQVISLSFSEELSGRLVNYLMTIKM